MEQIEILVTEDVKREAIRETIGQPVGAVATLCYTPSTGYAMVRRIGVGDEIDSDSTQVIDLSANDAYGSYIDSLVDTDSRLRIPGNPEILAIWSAYDDTTISSLVDEYIAMTSSGVGADWGIWVKYNALYLYTLDDAAFDIWEMVVEDIEYDGRYIVVEPGE